MSLKYAHRHIFILQTSYAYLDQFWRIVNNTLWNCLFLYWATNDLNILHSTIATITLISSLGVALILITHGRGRVIDFINLQFGDDIRYFLILIVLYQLLMDIKAILCLVLVV